MSNAANTNYLLLPIGDSSPEEINVVVEIPQGSRNKYEYDKNMNVFRLDRALHSPIYYPGDYGFVPQTLAEDDDPLDVLILVIQPTFPGCLVVARPIGLLKMIDDGKPDDKVLAVPVGEPAYHGVHTQSQIFPHTLRTIQHFFETYKLLEGKETSTQGWQDAAAARRSVVESIERFREANPDHMPDPSNALHH
ncbi:MAG: inorganic diphosphatase [Candidatus Eremiobacteraeota bacterium]|nr:inorganic diphosphatase [Candidatus Eremiobacteraeota bacterium]